MAADGDPPSLVNEMLSAHFDERYEVVICTRQERDESLGRTLASRLFYWLIRKLSFPDMPLGGFDFLLLGRRARDAVLRNWEAHAFFQGQVLWTGFRPKFLRYHRRERISGKSR
jgi:dolichol-phosphate mannosyltransferase